MLVVFVSGLGSAVVKLVVLRVGVPCKRYPVECAGARTFEGVWV